MGHPNFSSEIDVSELGLPIPPEFLEEQLNRYTRSMRVSPLSQIPLTMMLMTDLQIRKKMYNECFVSQPPDLCVYNKTIKMII